MLPRVPKTYFLGFRWEKPGREEGSASIALAWGNRTRAPAVFSSEEVLEPKLAGCLAQFSTPQSYVFLGMYCSPLVSNKMFESIRG